MRVPERERGRAHSKKLFKSMIRNRYPQTENFESSKNNSLCTRVSQKTFSGFLGRNASHKGMG